MCVFPKITTQSLYNRITCFNKNNSDKGIINDEVHVDKDQEKAESKKDSHSKNRGGKKPN